MGLMKGCQDILDNGTKEEKYQAAAFVIQSSVKCRNLPTSKERQELYGSMIDAYCRQYGLAKTALGKHLATGVTPFWALKEKEEKEEKE